MKFFELLPYLNNFMVAIASIATAIATVALFRVTRTLAVETKRMADSAASPQVVASIIPNQWSLIHMDIEVENTGNSTAFDIRVEFNPPIKADKSSEKNSDLTYQKVSHLKPGQKLSSWLGNFGDYEGKQYEITTSWKNSPKDKNRVSMTYSMDMADYDNVIYLGERDPSVQIANEFKKIREIISPILKGHKKLQADVFNNADRKEIRKAQEERIKVIKEKRKQK